MVAQSIGLTDFMGRDAIFMLDSLPIKLIIGCLLGFLAGLGVGGGSLLILWLTLVIGLEHTAAKSINLMFFIPTALIASFFRWKQGVLKLKTVLPAIIFGCISAGIFSILSKHLDVQLLKKLFGILLLVTGVRELLYKPKKGTAK